MYIKISYWPTEIIGSFSFSLSLGIFRLCMVSCEMLSVVMLYHTTVIIIKFNSYKVYHIFSIKINLLNLQNETLTLRNIQ